jgi:hypothetical protein
LPYLLSRKRALDHISPTLHKAWGRENEKKEAENSAVDENNEKKKKRRKRNEMNDKKPRKSPPYRIHSPIYRDSKNWTKSFLWFPSLKEKK